MDINSVAVELYSLPPEEFTAARHGCEMEAKAAGDKQLATAIHSLRKPSTGAWLANQLVRAHSDEVQSLLALGAELREATVRLSGDQLRELSKQRRQRVNALMQQVRGLASATGHKVSQDTARGLEDTLHAALADERVADQLIAGRLTETLHGAGFPSTPGITFEKPAPDSTSTESATNPSSEQLQVHEPGRAEREEQQARAAVRDAEDDLDQARVALDRTDTALQKVTRLVGELRANLEEAEREQSLREQEHHESQADLDRATRAARDAARRLDDSAQRRERPST